MAPKLQKNKKNNKKDDDDFETIMKEFQPQSVAAVETSTFYFYALSASILPAYMFLMIFDLSLADAGIFFALVTAASTYMLSTAYSVVAKHSQARLSRQASSQNRTPESIKNQATSFSLFFNNVVFFGLFGFIAFYALQGVDDRVRYTLSVSLASALAWQLAPYI